jgi:hypothetical protein
MKGLLAFDGRKGHRLYKTEVIHRRSPWRRLAAVELATLEWVAWFNHSQLLQPIGFVPPAEAETAFYRALESQPIAAKDSNQPASAKPDGVDAPARRHRDVPWWLR